MFHRLVLRRRVNFVKGRKNAAAKFGENGSGHLFADAKADHVDGVEELEGQHLALLPSARKHNARIRYQVPN